MSSPLDNVPLIVRMPSEMLTSRSSLLTPAVRAFMMRFSSVSYTSTANCPGKSSSWSSHVAFASFAAGAGVVAAACGAATGSARSMLSSFKNAAASSSSISRSSFCLRAMTSST